MPFPLLSNGVAPQHWALLIRIGMEESGAANPKLNDPEKHVSTLIVKESGSDLSIRDTEAMQEAQRLFQMESCRPYEPWSTYYPPYAKKAQDPIDWSHWLNEPWEVIKGNFELSPSLKMAHEANEARPSASAFAQYQYHRETDDTREEGANKDTRRYVETIAPSDVEEGIAYKPMHAWRSQRMVLLESPEESVPENKLLVIYEKTVGMHDELFNAQWQSSVDTDPRELELSSDTFREVMSQCRRFPPFSQPRPPLFTMERPDTPVFWTQGSVTGSSETKTGARWRKWFRK